jgi:hypothetical protein
MDLLLVEFRNSFGDSPGRPKVSDPAKRILFAVFRNLICRAEFAEAWDAADELEQEEILETNLRFIREGQA